DVSNRPGLTVVSATRPLLPEFDQVRIEVLPVEHAMDWLLAQESLGVGERPAFGEWKPHASRRHFADVGLSRRIVRDRPQRHKLIPFPYPDTRALGVTQPHRSRAQRVEDQVQFGG